MKRLLMIISILFTLLLSSCKEGKNNIEVQQESNQNIDTLLEIHSNNNVNIKPTANNAFKDTLQYIGESEYSDYQTSLFLTNNFKIIPIVLNKKQVLSQKDRNKMLVAEWEKHLVTAAGDNEVEFEMAFMKKYKHFAANPFKAVSIEDISETNQFNILILNFLSNIKTNNIEALANTTRYPLKREYPLPSIKSEEQFISYYPIIFTDSLRKVILNSDLQTEWSPMGYKGLMLKNGVLWLDVDGNLIAVSSQSSLEKKKRKAIIENEKKRLHTSVNQFHRPELLWETETFRIRIDEVGNDKYRYVAWKKDKMQSEKPDLIIKDGIIVLEGNGGNHHFEFNNGVYKYECHIIKLGETGHPPGWLIVYNSNDEIFKEEVIKVLNE